MGKKVGSLAIRSDSAVDALCIFCGLSGIGLADEDLPVAARCCGAVLRSTVLPVP